MTFVYADQNTDAINQLLMREGTKKCAVAFLGHRAIATFQDVPPETTKIICNLESGATNPYAVEELIRLGIQVRTINNLHAKVYLDEGIQAIVGSANLSANGLSYEDDEVNGWLEAGVLVEDETTLSEINKWFDTQWDDVASDITSVAIQNAKEIWSRRRNNRPLVPPENSILGSLRSNPNIFLDRNIFIVIYRDNEPLEISTQAFENVMNDFDVPLNFFENGDDLPRNAYFISIYYERQGEGEGVRVDNCYYYRPNLDSIQTEDQENITLVFEKNSMHEMVLTEDDRGRFDRQLVSRLWESCNDNNNSAFISLYDARNIIFNE